MTRKKCSLNNRKIKFKQILKIQDVRTISVPNYLCPFNLKVTNNNKKIFDGFIAEKLY